MNDRERYIATLLFQRPDRVPFAPGGGRKSTIAAWHRQGLPENVTDYLAYARQQIGMPSAVDVCREHPGVVLTMMPEFEEKVIERRPSPDGTGADGTLVVQDWKGNICEISDRFDPSYLRGAPDFVTRTWIRCPVTARADWRDMAARYDASDPRRFPDDWHERCQRLRRRTGEVGLIFPGPFWQLREWVGFEPLCVLFLDDPDFVREMIGFWQDFISAMLGRIFLDFVPDFVMLNEDMAYKEKPMIGPDMARTFLQPTWRTWGDICRDAGVPIYGIDSDGYVGSLIPVWMEAGVRWNAPLEVAAGNDLPGLRRQFGERMAHSGGVDKRAIAQGGRVIEQEIQRLQPVIDAGGYIPGCDHGIPADVTWPNFLHYCRLLARATGWL